MYKMELWLRIYIYIIIPTNRQSISIAIYATNQLLWTCIVLNSNPSINAIHTVKQGILNSNGELKFSSPFNSFCIFSYHANEGLPGGVAIFTTAFSPNVIKHASHNGGIFVIEGTTNEGYTIKTNTPNGKYRIIISKNYD